jgi:hypothetical protein
VALEGSPVVSPRFRCLVVPAPEPDLNKNASPLSWNLLDNTLVEKEPVVPFRVPVSVPPPIGSA